MKTFITCFALTVLAFDAEAKDVEIRNDLDSGVSFVVQSDAMNVTSFSQSGSVGAKQTTRITVPDDVNSVKYVLTRGNENTGWVHTFLLGARPKEHLDFSGGYTWRSNK